MNQNFFVFGTSCNINFNNDNYNYIMRSIINKLNNLDDDFSKYKNNSFVSIINHNAGKNFIVVSKDVIEIVKASIKFSKLTNGALDITSNLINKDLINYKNIIINNENSIKLKKSGMCIDLGALAKGYATDLVVDILDSYNIKNALIDLGGNIFVKGLNNKNLLWKVGIQDPYNNRFESVGYIELSNKSVVTSGLYERGNHIINPKSGCPVENNIASVSIISDKSIDGEGLSTSCFVLGIKKSIKLLKKLKKINYIILTKDKKIICSNNLIDEFKITNKDYTFIEKR